MADMMRRIVAEQLAAALADALPGGSFDRAEFVRRALADDAGLPAASAAAS